MEGRALARPAVGPDAPAVLVDDLLADREADAGPLEAVGAVQALERPEDEVALARREADAVVVDRHMGDVVLAYPALWRYDAEEALAEMAAA